VTLARRLAALETSLTPTGRILAWLDEAHASGSLEAYVDSLLDRAPEAFPINRLAREAAESARKDAGRAPADVVDTAVRKALRATIFRFELVMRINVVAHEMIDREGLVHAALSGQLAILVSDDQTKRRSDDDYLRRLGQCRDLTATRVVELRAEQEARSSVEARYLAGHPALFPDGIDQWAERLRLAQELAVLADRIAELDGVPPAPAMDPDAITVRAALLAADLIEPPRSTTLDKLDEGRQALRIATGWLRSKAQARASAIDREPHAMTSTL
jgi:hypothetical protein